MPFEPSASFLPVRSHPTFMHPRGHALKHPPVQTRRMASRIQAHAQPQEPAARSSKPFVRQNPIPFHQLDQLLTDLQARGVDDQAISPRQPQTASETLLKVGTHLLQLEKELASTPILGTAKSNLIQPASLVVYREVPMKGYLTDPSDGKQYKVSPILQVLREIERPEGTFSELHNTMKMWNVVAGIFANGMPPWHPLHLAHGLTQALAFLSKPDRFNLPKHLTNTAQTLQNHAKGMGLIRISEDEKKELVKTANGYGFEVEEDKTEFAQYGKQVFRMLSQTMETIKDLEQSGHEDLKVGIAYKTGQSKETIHDVTDIFPECNLLRVRKPSKADRERLEKLFNRKNH